MMKRLLLTVLLIATCIWAPAQTARDYASTADDIALAKVVLEQLSAAPQETPGAQMVRAAKALLGQPYEAGTQEGPEERLRIYLTRTDCILFAETCLGLVRTVQRCGPLASFEDLAQTLRGTRYRGGTVDGYASRLHYTTEWIRQGIENGLFEDITPSLGGVADTRPINFMSTHPDSYAPLKGESPYARDNRARIAAMEERVSAMPRCYLPKERIAAVEDRIQDGDILCFATSVGGLDYSHVVIAYRAKKGGRLGFIHASTSAMKVIVEPRTLEEYLQARKSATGVTVLRVKD